ncbi:MAG: hypothetical protein PHZ23_15535 [Acidiphilium sp.]|nr:hypothetical protein [Acidiphilium sp.]
MGNNQARRVDDRRGTNTALVVCVLNGQCLYSGYQPLEDAKEEVCFDGIVGGSSSDYMSKPGSGASRVARLAKETEVVPVWLSKDLMTSPVWQQLKTITSLLITFDVCASDVEKFSTGWNNTPVVELIISLQWALECLLPRGLSEPTEAHKAAYSVGQKLGRLVDNLLRRMGSRHIEYPPRTFYGRYTSVEKMLDLAKIDGGDVRDGQSAWIF